MGEPNTTALALVLIGALMGVGREGLTKFYAFLYVRLRHAEPHPRLIATLRLYVVFTSMIFSAAGMLGLLGVVRF